MFEYDQICVTIPVSGMHVTAFQSRKHSLVKNLATQVQCFHTSFHLKLTIAGQISK